jgi:hypothetical protein
MIQLQIIHLIQAGHYGHYRKVSDSLSSLECCSDSLIHNYYLLLDIQCFKAIKTPCRTPQSSAQVFHMVRRLPLLTLTPMSFQPVRLLKLFSCVKISFKLDALASLAQPDTKYNSI